MGRCGMWSWKSIGAAWPLALLLLFGGGAEAEDALVLDIPAALKQTGPVSGTLGQDP